MTAISLRSKVTRALMASGATAVFVGVAFMVHGEVHFGDGVLVTGILAFIVGVVLLAQTPTGDNDAG